MHLRIHFLLLVVLLGYSSTSYAQQAGVGKSGVASTAAAVSDSPAAETAESDSDHPVAAPWSSKDDIYIDDNPDDDDDDDEDDWEDGGSGVRPGYRKKQPSSGRVGGGGSGRNRDDLEASGSGEGPVRNRGGTGTHIVDEEDEDIDQGSGAPPPDVRVPQHKKPEDKSKKPSYPPKEPKEEVRKQVPEVGKTPDVTSDFEEDPHKGTDKEIPVLPEEDSGDSVFMNKAEDRATSFFSQPGILAAVIGGAVVGLLCAILVVMFIVYRMRKKDEGSYALDEPKRSPTVNSYTKNSNREFYA